VIECEEHADVLGVVLGWVRERQEAGDRDELGCGGFVLEAAQLDLILLKEAWRVRVRVLQDLVAHGVVDRFAARRVVLKRHEGELEKEGQDGQERSHGFTHANYSDGERSLGFLAAWLSARISHRN
jgi:hypothetical protein